MKKILFSLFVMCLSVSVLGSAPLKTITPETALEAYLHNGDKSFKWEVIEKARGEGVTLYRISMLSQQWRGTDWNHEMMIVVPDLLKYNDALLFITGGSVANGKPKTHQWTDDLVSALGFIAKTNMSMAAIIWQVPNQPLYGDLTEDALISFTLHNYLNDHDFTWPLLFPMTKSAVRAMDVVQKFAKREIKRKVKNFIVAGASKRGWTTWLTAANDDRVKAICPMVIDVLNMPVNVDYQKKVWGDYSIEIEDYVKLGIARQLGTPGGNDLTEMIDPYSYRKKLNMPKMIFMGTNDPYWPVDAVKNYIDSIPGENFICYIPNAAHDLGDKKQAFTTLGAFWGNTVAGRKYPACDYTVSEKNDSIILKVKFTPGLLIGAFLWSSGSVDQDFRDEKWVNQKLNVPHNREITVRMVKPESGFKAFYVDLRYKAMYGADFTQSTRMFVTSHKKLMLNTDQQ